MRPAAALLRPRDADPAIYPGRFQRAAGRDVSPASWSDLWLNEGHATWYAILYSASKGDLDETYGVETVEELMQELYSAGDDCRAQFGPVAEPRLETCSSPQAYEGGALVLYALRQQVGTRTFERIEREWVPASMAARSPRLTSSTWRPTSWGRT